MSEATLTYTYRTDTYTIEEVEVEVSAFDAEGYEVGDTFYGYHLSGPGIDYNSLDDTDDVYQCWDHPDDAYLKGLEHLFSHLQDKAREEIRSAA